MYLLWFTNSKRTLSSYRFIAFHSGGSPSQGSLKSCSKGDCTRLSLLPMSSTKEIQRLKSSLWYSMWAELVLIHQHIFHCSILLQIRNREIFLKNRNLNYLRMIYLENYHLLHYFLFSEHDFLIIVPLFFQLLKGYGVDDLWLYWFHWNCQMLD